MYEEWYAKIKPINWYFRRRLFIQRFCYYSLYYLGGLVMFGNKLAYFDEESESPVIFATRQSKWHPHPQQPRNVTGSRCHAGESSNFFSLTPRFTTVSYALVPTAAKFAQFGSWEEIARYWEIVECREYGQKVGPRFFYHKLKMEHLFNHTDSQKKATNIITFRFFYFESRLGET